jgi:hypothetical protein
MLHLSRPARAFESRIAKHVDACQWRKKDETNQIFTGSKQNDAALQLAPLSLSNDNDALIHESSNTNAFDTTGECGNRVELLGRKRKRFNSELKASKHHLVFKIELVGH